MYASSLFNLVILVNQYLYNSLYAGHLTLYTSTSNRQFQSSRHGQSAWHVMCYLMSAPSPTTAEIAPRSTSPDSACYRLVLALSRFKRVRSANTWLAKRPTRVVPGAIVNGFSLESPEELPDCWKWKDLPRFVMIYDEQRRLDVR